MQQKKTSQVLSAHAKKRAEERYGLSLNHDQRREIVDMIQSQQAEFIGKQSNTRSLWRVQFQDQSLNVVYDKARRAMCTVLPKEAYEFQDGTDWKSTEDPEREAQKLQTRRNITAELAEIWKDA